MDFSAPSLLSSSSARLFPDMLPQEQIPAQTQELFAKQLAEVEDLRTEQAISVEKEEVVAAEKNEKTESLPQIARSWHMASAEKTTEVREDTDLSWGDFLDLINPLQHIPVVGTLYRELTGDEIKPEIRVAGSALFGLATGSLAVSLASGLASAIYEEHSGQEPTVQIAQGLFGEELVGGPSPDAGDVQLLAAAPSFAEKDVALLAAAKEKAVNPAANPVVTATNVSAPLVASMASEKAAENMKGVEALAALDANRKAGRPTEGMRIGSKLYPKKAYTSVNRDTTKQEASPQTLSESAALAAMMQEQAQAKAAGQTLPPELVRDMMVKAFDKYRAAQKLGEQAPASRIQ